jgi:isoquinoline 1-oxidoreductase
MVTASGLDRRSFFQRIGGGIVVLVSLGPDVLRAQDSKPLYPEDFNAYLLVGENGRVTVFSGKIEMGQGVLTSQAQMVAEELGVELSAVDMVLGDTDRCPWDRGTFGSLTTRMFGPALRAAGAQARLVLMTLACEHLGVPLDGLEVHKGVVSVLGDRTRSVSYAALSKGARIMRVVDRKAILLNVADFKLMGTSPQRLDALEKVTGAAKYAADIRLAGMLFASVLRPPMHGAILKTLDTSAAEKMEGTTVVRREDLIAVLHADPQTAAKALAAIQTTWQLPQATPDTEGIFNHILAKSVPLTEVVNLGDVVAAKVAAERVFETRFEKGYVAHAPLEPHAALAEFKNGRMTVWASTQTPFPARDQIAKVLGLSSKDVRVITPLLGGGFGGKSAFGQAIEAARLAQITGQPVQVSWSRAEEFFNDTFDPAAVVKVTSGLDRHGQIVLWDYAVYAAGTRGTTLPYSPPNNRIRSAGKTAYEPVAQAASVHPFAVGAWRGPGANMNVFAAESQIDIMAASLAIDPLEFRLRNLTDPRMVRVLKAAASAFGWEAAPAPSGRGYGLACVIDAGTYVATMAEVRVNATTGHIQVLRVVCAQDMGIVVNPEGARMQIEGGLTMGLGYTLSEELRFRGGEILDRNFDSYEIPRFSTAAPVLAVLVKNDELAPQGGGEPAITTTGAVIANAVFDAVGVRLLRLPLLPDRVRAAIAAR